MEKLEQASFNLDALNKYGTDLTKLAQEGKLDPVIGRQQQIEQVTQILCKRRKNNACLTGDPGVGKTVIVEGIAQHIVNASIPLKLREKKIFSVDMGRIIAGASNRGEFEERITKVVDEVKQSNGGIILFIDELHTLIGSGGGGQALDASNILKPALARGELKCVGATTLDEYRKYIEKDPALKRRFQTVDVPEPTIEDTIEILKGLCPKYATHHNVHYTDQALIAAARLSKQFISDRFLPDKAIDLIDEAGSSSQLHNVQGSSSKVVPVVTEAEIQNLIYCKTGIPVEKVSGEESIRLLKLEEALQRQMIGQDEAVKAVSCAIRRARVGLRDPSRPVASFLFTGPTGVGKTQLAKLIAVEYFGSKEATVRIDMSEYMERHTVSKLIGSPPGYIGHDDGGQLTEAIRRRAHNLVLFDEIEKAHKDVFNAMLQILDDGRLTDGKGRTVDFSNTIIIMTSNIGGHLTGQFEKVKQGVALELKKNFRPEFLNRLDEVLVFKHLDYNDLNKILDVMLAQVYERVKGAKNIEVQLTDMFRKRIIEEGYNQRYGVRPLKRAITRLLENSLAERILRGEVMEGEDIIMDANSKGEILLAHSPKF
ncbi:hypothetical protein LguiB_008633 [Lonicera macranthoides]